MFKGSGDFVVGLVLPDESFPCDALPAARTDVRPSQKHMLQLLIGLIIHHSKTVRMIPEEPRWMGVK